MGMIILVLYPIATNAYIMMGEPLVTAWVYGDFNQWVNVVSWSPNGERLATGIGRSLIILNRDGTLNWSKDGLGKNQFDSVRSVAWSPDGGS